MLKIPRIRIRLFDSNDRIPAPAPPRSEWPLRPGNFLLSMLVHGSLISVLAYLPSGAVQAEKQVQAEVYKVIDLKKEPIIYWARVPAALPTVSPETPIGDSARFRGQERSRRENIVVQQPNADPAKQLVWQPDKPERLQIETPLQNMVAVQGKPAPKPFVPPKERPASLEPQNMLAAPEARAVKAELPGKVAGLPSLPADKPKPKAFVAPREQPKLTLAAATVAEAPPELAMAAPKPASTGTLVATGAIPKRPAPFVPPPSKKQGSRGGNSDGSALSAPPEVSAGGTGSTVTAAVVGLNPTFQTTSLPDGSRSAAFSRAAKVGEPSGGAPGQGPVIPGVAIAGNRRANTSISPLPATVPSGMAPRSFDMRIPPAASTMSAPLRPSSRTLPRAIEARFRERIVYVLVIPKPNLPDYIADWTMWFSERASDALAGASMRAPVPVRKTLRPDAAPTPGVSGSEAWVQIAAVIDKDGKVSSVAPMPGRNPAVAAKAAEDLANWQFRPASRNGEAIEVEVIVEVPFHVR